MKVTPKFTDIQTNLTIASEPAFKVVTPMELKDVFKELIPYVYEQEHFAVAVLNGQMELLGSKVLFMGAGHMAHIDMGILARYVISFPGARRFAVCHNHPSGLLTPSQEDIYLTHDIVKMGNLININLADHLILAGDKALSFQHSGLMDVLKTEAKQEPYPGFSVRELIHTAESKIYTHTF